LIDSTGVKAEGEGEWNARKHGGRKRRLWRKIHTGIDEETLEVRAVEVTTSNVGDAPMLSFHRTRTPNCGSLQVPEPSPGTRRSRRRDIWAARSGDDGADITAVAASRPGCIA